MRNYLLGAAGTYLAAVIALQSANCRTPSTLSRVGVVSVPGSVPVSQSSLEKVIEGTKMNSSCALVINKTAQTLSLYYNGSKLHTFPAEFGPNSEDKVKEGDKATPEGRYKVGWIKEHSPFYKSLGIDYPNEQDWEEFNRLQNAGILSPTDTIGGGITIHGGGGGSSNWTSGCVAVNDEAMDLLFRYVQQGKIGIGTPIFISK